MNRKLLIISNAGPLNDLQGIDLDRKNYRRFFSSPEGGLWNFNEKNGDAILAETNEVDAQDFLSYIKNTTEQQQIAYWVIVFVGHGFAGASGKSYLEICPKKNGVKSICSIAEIKNAVGIQSRCLLITDCCRVCIPCYESGGQISDVLTFSTDNDDTEVYRHRCRRMYDAYWAKVPAGAFFIGQACSFGQESSGDDVFGGRYSSQLLKCAKDLYKSVKKDYMHPNFEPQGFSFSYVHTLAKPFVISQSEKDGDENIQTPQFSGPRCNQPPFCVVAKSDRQLIFG